MTGLKLLRVHILRRRLIWLIKSPIFWAITIWGNSCVFGGATIFYILEKDQNPNLTSFIDSVAWAVGIVTTVGSGEVHPVTVPGKLFNILMMMGGAVFLWSYMAMFVGILVDPELTHIQKEISKIQHDVRDLEGRPNAKVSHSSSEGQM